MPHRTRKIPPNSPALYTGRPLIHRHLTPVIGIPIQAMPGKLSGVAPARPTGHIRPFQVNVAEGNSAIIEVYRTGHDRTIRTAPLTGGIAAAVAFEDYAGNRRCGLANFEARDCRSPNQEEKLTALFLQLLYLTINEAHQSHRPTVLIVAPDPRGLNKSLLDRFSETAHGFNAGALIRALKYNHVIQPARTTHLFPPPVERLEVTLKPKLHEHEHCSYIVGHHQGTVLFGHAHK